jgi:translocation and assembly module TamB
MTQPPTIPPNNPNPRSRRIWSTIAKIGAGVGGVALVAGGAALIWGGDALNDQLIPWVEESLEKSLDRPIELGNIESLSFNGVRLGPSSLPPTDEVETEATVEAVELSISWPDLLFNLTARTSITLIEPNATVIQSEDGRWIDLTLPDPEEDKTQSPIEFELDTVRVKNGTISINRAIARPDAVVEAEPIVIDNLNAIAEFLSPNEQDLQEVLFEVKGRVGEGEFQAKGDALLEDQAYNVSLQTTDLPAGGANLFLPPALGITSGTLNSNLAIELRLQNQDQPATIQGTARLRDGEVQLNQLTEPIADIDASLRFQGEQVILEEAGLQVGDIPLEAAGTVNLDEGYDLTATIPRVSIENLTNLLEVDLPLEAAGEFQLDTTITGPLREPRLVGNLENLGDLQVDRVAVNGLTANFAATPEQIDLRSLRIIPAEGGFITAEGKVDLEDLANPAFDIALQTDLPGDALAATFGASLPNNIVIGSVQADAQIQGTLKDPRVQAQFRLPESTYPGRGELTFRNRTLLVDNAQFQVEEGRIDADAIVRLDQNTWTANLSTANVPLNRFTNQAQGLLSAELTSSGSLNNLSLQGIQASGSARVANAALALGPGAPSLLEPGDWTTNFRWVGDGLQIENFSAPGLDAAGFVAVNPGTPSPIGPLDLNVQLRNYDLNRLAQLAPPQVQEQLSLAGTANFNGDLRGELSNLQLAGNVDLNQLAINTFEFAPQLSGPVDFALNQGGTINLQGGGDRIVATIGPDFLPETFDIRQGEFTATGQVVDRQLTATVQNFPIETLNLSPAAELGLGPLGGLLSADITADLGDLSTLTAAGTANVVDPALGTILADVLDAEFRYANGRLEIIGSDLQFKNSQYQLTGWLELEPTPQFYAELDIVSGNFQDILSTLNWSTFADIGFNPDVADRAGAEALQTVSVGLPMTTFLGKLQAFAEFMVQYDKRMVDTEYALPPLDQLEGNFAGTIIAQGDSLDPQDIQVSADIQGQNWAWGGLLPCEPAETATPCNRFLLDATYDQGVVAVTPLLFEADQARISLQGEGRPENLEGQLQISGIPVALAEAFIDLPVNLDGQLEAIALFSGSLNNPYAKGTLTVINPSINQQALEAVNFDFTYDLAHLRFDGAIVAAEPAKATITGDIPYALPFMTVQPDTNMIDIEAVLRNDGLEILNLATNDQVRWEDGQGEVRVQVGGTLSDPAVVGKAQFVDGVITNSALNQPIENLTGEVQFNLEQVRVNQLQANYGGGDIVVTGQIPVANSDTSTAGLNVTLSDVSANYDGFVQADLDGDLIVAGAALDPVLTGTVRVQSGRVYPNELLRRTGALPDTTSRTVEERPLPRYIQNYKAENIPPLFPEATSTQDIATPLERFRLNNLVLVLEDELLIIGQPFYNLTASGDITINGTLTDLRPQGVITLNSGWINLFATQFRLQRDAENTAIFTPQNGLDPFLNVQMLARVRDTNVTRVTEANPFNSAEITEPSGITTFGEVEFLTVYATAYGYASELQNTDNPRQASELLTLTSRPSRNQDQLLALLGSSVVTNLYGASFNQLAGFVGAGSIASFGERFADAVGLRSFSIFPTTNTSTETTAGIGIGVEAAFDIGNSFSADILEIINSSNPPQLGLSYRITDELRLRGTTNFSGDETLTIQYETRF